MRTIRRLILAFAIFFPPALWGHAALATEWFGAGGDQGVHYLGHNETTGGSTPSIGSPHTTSPSGDPNPAPDGTASRSAPARPAAPSLTTPPNR
jgi:hypothetical protein